MRPLAGMLLAMTVALAAQAPPVDLPPFDYANVRLIAIHDGGRAKPLDTFARETARLVTGREYFRGRDPMDLLFSLLAETKAWQKRELVAIDYRPLKERAGLELGKKRFAPGALFHNARLMAAIRDATVRRRQGRERLALDGKALEVSRQLERLRSIFSGRALRLVPPADGAAGHAWSPVVEIRGQAASTRRRLYGGFRDMVQAYAARKPQEFAAAAKSLRRALFGLRAVAYPSARMLAVEVSYNALKPFRKAWIVCLAAFLLLLASRGAGKRWLHWTGIGALGLAFAFQTAGLIMRIAISGRAPVSNMYESIVFLGWGVILIALVFEATNRSGSIAPTAALLGVAVLVIADAVPLDSGINPLVPVLRNTVWLTIHVITIMLSYSAFALAMGLAHVALGMQLFTAKERDLIDRLGAFVNRTLQVGLLLLTAGIVFGAIWADSAWGRYWGWDPKETWSLITLLGYLAVIHARHAGWIREFGVAVCAILGFVLVLMTYYGVNYILGTGLHSYGFGTGGWGAVLGYLFLELLFLAAVTTQRARGVARTAAPGGPEARIPGEHAIAP